MIWMVNLIIKLGLINKLNIFVERIDKVGIRCRQYKNKNVTANQT